MEEREKRENLVNAGNVAVQAKNIQRYGSAIKEHVVAYSGVDNSSKTRLAKGLKEISESKVNPDYRDINIKQQAGFAAEIKTVARENAERIINGNDINRTVRTDDLTRQADGKGHTVGGANEQLYDVAEIDSNGIYVEGTARQLKFVGGNPGECTKKLLSKKYDKYRDADVPIEVPADFYDGVKEELTNRSKKLQVQIEDAEKKGNSELADKHRIQLKKVNKTKESLQKGKVRNGEAIEARLHPELSTAKDMTKLSHQAGIKAAKMGAAIGGGMSFIHNSVAVIKGDKTADEAVLSVAEDTATAAVAGYATNFAGTQLTGILSNAPSQYLQTLAKTNLPATVIASALGIGRTLARFGRGEIDGIDCFIELGETGVGTVASSAGALVGQVIIPIPVVGALVGSMAGYAMSSAYYNELVTLAKSAKIAHDERVRIETECKEAIDAIREYRLQTELAIRNYLVDSIAVFSSAFAAMEVAYNTGDVNQFVFGSNLIIKQLGGKPMFENKDEFDRLMNNTEPIIL